MNELRDDLKRKGEGIMPKIEKITIDLNCIIEEYINERLGELINDVNKLTVSDKLPTPKLNGALEPYWDKAEPKVKKWAARLPRDVYIGDKILLLGSRVSITGKDKRDGTLGGKCYYFTHNGDWDDPTAMYYENEFVTVEV
jgi:hypothetical protein